MFVPSNRPIQWRPGMRFAVYVHSPDGDPITSQHKTPDGTLRRVGELGVICEMFAIDEAADRELRVAEDAYMEKQLRGRHGSGNSEQ